VGKLRPAGLPEYILWPVHVAILRDINFFAIRIVATVLKFYSEFLIQN